MSPLRVSLLVALSVGCGCGSKTGALVVDVERDGGADAGDADAAFETFPCRWNYAQPTVVAREVFGSFREIGGAVHGRQDTVWVHAEDVAAGDGRVSAHLGLADPASVLEPPPTLSEPALHGIDDGWTALAPDCSLAFFDDDARPRRLVVETPAFAPCALERNDARFIDITHLRGRDVAALRYDDGGALVHDVVSDVVGDVVKTVTSPDGRMVIAIAQQEGGAIVAELLDVSSSARLAGPAVVAEDASGVLSVALDRLRPAALVLLPGRGSATLVRLPFDAGDFGSLPLATTPDALLDPRDAVVTNETEALMVLSDGRLAIQPLSGSRMRFLPPPDEAGVVSAMRVVLAPGRSRGGVLYAYETDAAGGTLAFRTLTCNR